MQTPIYDFLIQYAEKDPIRMHMPGHKGILAPPALLDASKLDLTEITGADSLFEAKGIIAQSENNAAKLFGSAYTFYSCAGSTLCIQAMLMLMKQEGRIVLAARNVHRAFLNAAVLLDLDVRWIYPQESDGILSGNYSVEAFESVLSTLNHPACIYVTSPDYLGHMADIKGLAELCQKYHARLLVDNAHGAHLAFLTENKHPICLGADYCCDSAHKMLSGLTGSAYLHVRSDITNSPERVRGAMSLFASTSPSYLLLASLDRCNRELASPLFRNHLMNLEMQIQQMEKRLAYKYTFVKGDTFHITIDGPNSLCNTLELQEYLEKNNVYVEYADAFHLVMLVSAALSLEDLQKVEDLLNAFLPTKRPLHHIKPHFPNLEQACSMREAAFAPSEEIPVEESIGRICAAVKVPCPPAVPLVISGERINREAVRICQEYNIHTICVVK